MTQQRAQVGWSAAIASWLLFGAAAFAPLLYGSNTSTAVAFWCIVLGACLALAPVRGLGTGGRALAGLAALVVAGYALVLHEQLAEHPWFASPDPIWREAATALGGSIPPSVSIARNQPWFELGRPLVCMLAIASGFLVGADGARARQLIKVIAWSGAAYAAYGILSHLFDPTHILLREKEAYLQSVTGTFINHNTAAAYFGSCSVMWSLLLWERLLVEMPRRPFAWRAVPTHLVSGASRKTLVVFSMLFLCLTAMFMTGSRAGVVLSLLALVLAFTAFFRRHLPRRAGFVTALAGASAVALVLLQFLGSGVNARFDFQGLADEGRFATYRATLRMIADHPWFGTGQGTFAYAFPAYRSPDVSILGVWDMAHNSLLEIAADMGVPIAALVVVGWIAIFAVLIHGARVRRQGLITPVAALAVATLAVLHSLIDFSLQIPGYAIVAFSLFGAGLAQSFSQARNQAEGGAPLSGSSSVGRGAGAPQNTRLPVPDSA